MTQTNTAETAGETKDPGYKPFTHDFFDAFSEKDVSVGIRFAQPGVKATERAQKQMMKSPNMALKNLCVSAVHPDDKTRMEAAFAAHPGLASTFGGALLKACGFGDLGN